MAKQQHCVTSRLSGSFYLWHCVGSYNRCTLIHLGIQAACDFLSVACCSQPKPWLLEWPVSKLTATGMYSTTRQIVQKRIIKKKRFTPNPVQHKIKRQWTHHLQAVLAFLWTTTRWHPKSHVFTTSFQYFCFISILNTSHIWKWTTSYN